MQIKLIAVSASVIASAFALYAGRQEASVQVATPVNAASAVAAQTQNTSQTHPQSTPSQQKKILSLQEARGKLQTALSYDHHDHDHDHDHDDDAELPEELKQAIEERRIPVSQLALTAIPGGYAMPTRGQHHTVVMAFIGDDGKLHRAERVVEPIADAPLTIPVASQPPAIPAASRP